MDQNEVERIATEVRSWIEDAAGDTAGTSFSNLMLNLAHDEAARAKVLAAKEDGVVDVCGWYADELFNDPDWLSDITGDRIFDECHGNYDDMIAVSRQMRDGAHEALRKAMDSHIEEWERRSAIIVVCMHCNTILKQKGEPETVSHSDCLAYDGEPCSEGRAYHWQVAQQLGYRDMHGYLTSMRPKKRQI